MHVADQLREIIDCFDASLNFKAGATLSSYLDNLYVLLCELTYEEEQKVSFNLCWVIEKERAHVLLWLVVTGLPEGQGNLSSAQLLQLRSN